MAEEVGGPDPEHIDIESTPVPGGNRISDSSRSYGGPMIHQYKYAILCSVLGFILVVAAVAMSAASLQRSNEALTLAETNTEAIEARPVYAQPAPAQPMTPAESNPAPTPPTPVAAVPESTPVAATPAPTPNPTSPPTFPPHPLNPQWFQTTHNDYQMIKEANEESGIHSFYVAQNMCQRQEMVLCPYEAYCPDDQGGEPFRGGPPKLHNSHTLRETQWAPFEDFENASTAEHNSWVQIGVVPAPDGDNSNQFGRCWKYDDWHSGSGKDIKEVWEEENRMWILCCERS